MSNSSNLNIAHLGATGAVGGHTLKKMLALPQVSNITTFGRRTKPELEHAKVAQHAIDIFEAHDYEGKLAGHQAAICTLGIGQPSKVSDEEFIKVDKTAVLLFAQACKQAGIKHFQLLASVGIDPKSRSLYLRTKGELVEELKKIGFQRLSIFKPSMIITPENRYGFSQALTLALWPVVDKLFFGPMKKLKGIKVNELGQAIAINLTTETTGFEELTWADFHKLLDQQTI